MAVGEGAGGLLAWHAGQIWRQAQELTGMGGEDVGGFENVMTAGRGNSVDGVRIDHCRFFNGVQPFKKSQYLVVPGHSQPAADDQGITFAGGD